MNIYIQRVSEMPELRERGRGRERRWKSNGVICGPQIIQLIYRDCERLFPTLKSRVWLEGPP